MTQGPTLTNWDLLDLPAGWHVCPVCKGSGRTIYRRYTRIETACQSYRGERVVAHDQYVRLMNPSWSPLSWPIQQQRRQA